MSDEDESEPEDDERIMKLITYSSKHSQEELAGYLKELGGEDTVIYGDIYAGKAHFGRAYLLLMGAACLSEEEPLGPQIEEKKALFQVAVGEEGPEAQAALLVMLELFCCKERRSGLDEFGDTLKVLWNRDIVAEELIESWWNNERALQEFSPKHFSQEDAETIRASSRGFIEWMQAGEDEA
eukprot:TRINITY_DN111012_c0_g1_i1.p1 TRINITY_DN111012_c0_g1~~TRINITY_DN111012_c0_g1_i1.p1  ORF type:complete len:182 (+),score=62.57 TRINITY_DN111012_c0_g1_i1:44-589(+)